MSSLFENKLNKLYESYGILNEGVQSIRPQYQMISDNDFNSLLKLDPTYQGDDNLGKYTKWILDLYKKFVKDRKEEEKYKKSLEYKKSHPDAIVNQPVYQSQDRIEDFQKIRDLLVDYEKYKKDIKQDVSKFNSIAELASAIRVSRDKDVSVDEQAKENYKVFREAMADGLKVVYNGSNFIIGVPETYEASSHFKKPVTDWCTAYPDMYEGYMNEYGGQYYIHLNKHTGELYQLHYNSNQFKNASDHEINKKEFISKYPELKKFYNKIIPFKYYVMWQLLSKQPTEKQQLQAVTLHGDAIQYIENPSEEVQLATVDQYGKAIQYIKNPSEKVQLAAVKRDGRAIQYINNPSEEVQLAAVDESGFAIEYIENPSEEIQLASVNEDGYVITYIKNPSEEVQLVAVKNWGPAIQFIENPSEEVQLAAVQNNENAIRYIKNPSMKVKHAVSLA